MPGFTSHQEGRALSRPVVSATTKPFGRLKALLFPLKGVCGEQFYRRILPGGLYFFEDIL